MSYSGYDICSSIIYIAVIVGGTFGNDLVCYIVYTNRNLRTSPNFHLISLAVADLIVCTTTSPIRLVVTVKRLVTSVIYTNDLECFGQTLTFYSSIITTFITLATIILTRAVGITNRVLLDTMRKVIYVFIAISYCIGFGYGITRASLGKEGPCGVTTVKQQVKISGMIGVVITWVSLLIVIISNFCICYITQSNQRALKSVLGDGGRHGKSTNIATVKLSLRLVVCFIVSYLPGAIQGFLVSNELVDRTPYLANLFAAIACTGSAVNPLIYTLTSSTFKNHLPWKKS
ncbi:neuromedin-U receptor 2-like [Saccoglossus kowalevskii]|uniref:Probable G-protein coupled receptor 83-like n=1 Tax=Saccoglossus kowalevskii TaxID=10224 RepID=A0ABM0M0I6_SACKO|nr:PREDICTED: probable G-protein coupled receptor 83-like [Saccoglossus kowalevskii]